MNRVLIIPKRAFTHYLPPGYINICFSRVAQPEQIKQCDSYLSINPVLLPEFTPSKRRGESALPTTWETNGADKVHYVLLTHWSGVRPNLSPEEPRRLASTRPGSVTAFNRI